MYNPLRALVVGVAALSSLSIGVVAELRAQQVGARQNTTQVTATAPPPIGNGLILGRVVDAATGQPIAGAGVTLNVVSTADLISGRGGSPPPSSRTNNDGYFLFRDLPKGSFPLVAQAPGYLASAAGRRRPDGPSQPVTLEQDQHLTDVVIRMWQYGAITGTVVDEAGEPVVDIAVRAVQRTQGGRLSLGVPVVTDDRGIYRISSLTPGDYLVSISASTTSVPVSFADAMRTAPAASASALARDLPAGLSSLALARGGGDGLRVGDSVIQTSSMSGAATAPQPETSGPMLAYQTVFYPSAPTPAAATIVHVQSGREQSGVDIRLRLVPTSRVSGTVTNPAGAVGTMGLRLVPAYTDTFTNEANMETAWTVVAADGRFTFLGVPAGQYRLKALRIPRPTPAGSTFQTVINYGDGGVLMMGGGVPALPPASPDPTLWADVPVTVSDRDVADVAVQLRRGVRASGRVVFEDGPAPALADLPRFGIGFTAADDRSVQVPPSVPVDGQFQFKTAEYPGGRYLLNVSTMPAGWLVKSAMVGDVDANERPINLIDDVNDIVVTLTARGGEISGGVRRPGSAGDPEATVFVFPADVQGWIRDGMPARRVKSIDAGTDGTFRVTGLGPGDYAVVAVPLDRAVDTRDATAMATLASAATRVTLALGDKKTVALTVAPGR